MCVPVIFCACNSAKEMSAQRMGNGLHCLKSIPTSFHKSSFTICCDKVNGVFYIEVGIQNDWVTRHRHHEPSKAVRYKIFITFGCIP